MSQCEDIHVAISSCSHCDNNNNLILHEIFMVWSTLEILKRNTY